MEENDMKKMNKQVLILNGDYQPLTRFPLSLQSMKKVLKALLRDSITVVKEYDETITIKNKVIHLPKIVVLKKFINLSFIPRFSRRNVYLRDNYTCQYCGKKFSYYELTYDHVIPRKLGGETKWDNIVTACKSCNGKKGGLTLEESNMKLIHPPFIPSLSHLEKNSKNCCKQNIFDWDEEDWKKEMEVN